MTTNKKTIATPAEVTIVEEKSIDIVAQDNQTFNLEKLISQGIDKGLTVDTMERLLAMRKELKSEWAKEQYNKSMAAFQSECPIIQKTKEVKTKTGQVAYRYAPIESIVEQIKPYLQKNGFSYSTSMELNGVVKASVKVIHVDGHSEVSEMTVPLGNQTQLMSQSQVVAAASTFAKRYAFCNAFGILTGDEDNDGANISKEETGQPQYTNDGNIVKKPKEFNIKNPELPISDPQFWKIVNMFREKGKTLTVEEKDRLKTFSKGKASQLIETLGKAKPIEKEDIPVIQQGQDLSPEDKNLVDSIPF